MHKILLIGNGGSVLDKEMGKVIDTFPGKIVRFNNYQIENFEKNIGTRTDIVINVWCGEPLTQDALEKMEPDITKFITGRSAVRRIRRKIFKMHSENILQITFGNKDIIELESKIGFSPATTGALACQRFLDLGCDVTIYGFDYLNPKKKHHYYNNEGSLSGHKPDREKNYFDKLLKRKRIKCLKEPEYIG